jgi:adenylosuccinate synthase
VTNTGVLLHPALKKDATMLFEGAQGTFLDIDHGTYPFVTSSNATSGGACTGSGVGPSRIDKVLGVMKAYTTRVGGGPLPSSSDDISDMLHNMGREFGATTGRPRRCGWFDAVAVRHAVMVNGIDHMAVTNLDGLDGLAKIKVCVAYKVDGKRVNYVPSDIDSFAKCEPVYKNFKDLPLNARKYLKALAELIDTKISIVSVGPARDQTMVV